MLRPVHAQCFECLDRYSLYSEEINMGEHAELKHC